MLNYQRVYPNSISPMISSWLGESPGSTSSSTRHHIEPARSARGPTSNLGQNNKPSSTIFFDTIIIWIYIYRIFTYIYIGYIHIYIYCIHMYIYIYYCRTYHWHIMYIYLPHGPHLTILWWEWTMACWSASTTRAGTGVHRFGMPRRELNLHQLGKKGYNYGISMIIYVYIYISYLCIYIYIYIHHTYVFIYIYIHFWWCFMSTFFLELHFQEGNTREWCFSLWFSYFTIMPISNVAHFSPTLSITHRLSADDRLLYIIHPIFWEAHVRFRPDAVSSFELETMVYKK